MPIVILRKRKNAHNRNLISCKKGKVRIIERSLNRTQEFLPNFLRLRSHLLNAQTIPKIRQGNIKIFTVLRIGKSNLESSALSISDGCAAFSPPLLAQHLLLLYGRLDIAVLGLLNFSFAADRRFGCRNRLCRK